MFILLFALLMNLTLLCSPIDNGWMGIKVLSTNKTSVDKLFETFDVDRSTGDVGYSTDDAYLRVTYAAAPCTEAPFGRGEFRVPENTVIFYRIRMKRAIKLSEFKFAKEKYKRQTHDHAQNLATYYSEELGIQIVAQLRDGVEYLASIEYRPGKEIMEKLKCKDGA